MHRQLTSSPMTILPYIVAWGVGGVEGILVLRFLAKLFAARPSHPLVAWLYRVSEPLVSPLKLLDEGQPRFGATLELSTLVMIGLVLLVGALCWMVIRRLVTERPAIGQLDLHRKR